MMIAHPPSQHLSNSGLHWTSRGYRDARHTEEALQFVFDLMRAPIHYICVENPIGLICKRIRKYDQLIHPYEFGDDARKATCLWLKHLPKLSPTDYVEPQIVDGQRRWGNQRNQEKSISRRKLRQLFYQGVARAMADQWGRLL
jgi:hypothetical protein